MDSAFDKIDTNKIQQGKYLREGKFGNAKELGLKGQLGALKRRGRYGETQNLSKKNLEDIHKIISDRLKKHATSSRINITWRDKRDMLSRAEKLIYTKGSEFTREDKKDLKRIINSLQKSGRKNIVNRNSNLGTGGNTPINRPSNLGSRPPSLRY